MKPFAVSSSIVVAPKFLERRKPVEYLYQVKSGAVRSYKLLPDGRRQVIGFHLPGDIFGVENGGQHRFTTEAITETIVCLTKRRNIVEEHGGRATAINNLVRLVTSNLQHAEEHMLLLGRKTALEKVAAFLVEMDDRPAATGVVILPMTRRDIADYLGLTVETVARIMTQLKTLNLLTFIGPSNNREIVLRDRAKLAAFDS
jgi:CRP/FNR family transcriptional regulator, nitrogen fixation regulation protein